MNVGFCMCGSFCTFSRVFPVLEELTKDYTVFPIFSPVSGCTDSRFGTAEDHLQHVEALCGRRVWREIADVEPIGPRKLLDILIVAPCTGNTLAKLSHSIADTSVTMAVKSHLRNARPVLIAVSTNDGLSGAAENIGRLLSRKHFYFVPFGQDDPIKKPASLVADFSRIPEATRAALEGIQLQPILLRN